MKYKLQKARSSRYPILFVKMAVAIGLIYWLAVSGQLDFSQLGDIEERWGWFLLAQVPFGLVQAISAWRWRLLMRIQEIDYSFREAFKLTLIGIFFNQVMIGSTGGDLYRAYAVCVEHPGKRSAAVTSVFVDRVIGLTALLLLVPVALLWHLDLVGSDATLIVLTVSSLAALFVLAAVTVVLLAAPFRRLRFVERLLSRYALLNVARQTHQAMLNHHKERGAMIAVFVSSVLIQLLVVAANVLFAVALLGTAFAWELFFLLIPLAHLAMAIPINPPGALGTGEAIYAYLLPYAGISQGGLICLIQRATFLIWAAPGALMYIARRPKNGGKDAVSRSKESCGDSLC